MCKSRPSVCRTQRGLTGVMCYTMASACSVTCDRCDGQCFLNETGFKPSVYDWSRPVNMFFFSVILFVKFFFSTLKSAKNKYMFEYRQFRDN